MCLELIFAESAFNKTCLYRKVRAPITKTRPNNQRQRAKSKKSATPTSKGKFYENADSANINVRRTVVGPPLSCSSLHTHTCYPYLAFACAPRHKNRCLLWQPVMLQEVGHASSIM